MKLYLLCVFAYLVIGIYQAWRRNDDTEEFIPVALIVIASAGFFAFLGVIVGRILK